MGPADLGGEFESAAVSGKFRRWKHAVDWIDKHRCIVVFETLAVAKIALNSAIVPYTLSLFVAPQPDDDEPRDEPEPQQQEEAAEEEEEEIDEQMEVSGEQVVLEQKENWEELDEPEPE